MGSASSDTNNPEGFIFIDTVKDSKLPNLFLGESPPFIAQYTDGMYTYFAYECREYYQEEYSTKNKSKWKKLEKNVRGDMIIIPWKTSLKHKFKPANLKDTCKASNMKEFVDKIEERCELPYYDAAYSKVWATWTLDEMKKVITGESNRRTTTKINGTEGPSAPQITQELQETETEQNDLTSKKDVESAGVDVSGTDQRQSKRDAHRHASNFDILKAILGIDSENTSTNELDQIRRDAEILKFIGAKPDDDTSSESESENVEQIKSDFGINPKELENIATVIKIDLYDDKPETEGTVSCATDL